MAKPGEFILHLRIVLLYFLLIFNTVPTKCQNISNISVPLPSAPFPFPPLCIAEDDKSNLDFPLMTPSDFPPLRFPASSPDVEIRKQQHKMVEVTQKGLSMGTTAFGTVAGLKKVGKIVWSPIKSILGSFFNFEGKSKDKILDEQIKDALTSQEVHQIRAKMDTLNLALDRMLSSEMEITMDLRKAEIPTVRAYSHEILQMLRNKDSILWHLNLVMTPHLLDFATLFGAIARISARLDPTQKASYDRDLVNLGQLLEDYEESVTPKRVAMLEYPFSRRDSGKTSYCGNAYQNSCTKVTNVTTISCAASKADEALMEHINEGTSPNSVVQNVRERWNYALRGQMAVYDPVSNFLACGTQYGHCMDDYKEVLKDQIQVVFENARKFVVESRLLQ